MKRMIRRIVSCLAFWVLFLGCGSFFRYILVDDTTSYTRITFHEMYEQENIDVLFVGSSHCYRSFIPQILDEKLGANTFNAGTSSQYLDGSYMIIREAAKYNDIKHIYLELYYDIADEAYKDRKVMTQTYIISDYLRPSLDKILFLLNASTKEHYPNSFILARRNWTDLFNAEYVSYLVITKGTDDYKNYDYTYVTDDSAWYGGKGYIANNERIEDWNYFSSQGWKAINLNDIRESWINILEDIIAFCDKKDIELTLVATPVSDFLLSGVGNYDEYIEYMQNIIADTDVEYYDFNLCKEQYFPNVSELFMDPHHLNCYGAETFSNVFADLINGEISEEELFYDSVEEKINHMEPTVFGVSYWGSYDADGKLIRDCKIVSSNDTNLEFEITLLPEEGEPYKLQEFMCNKSFVVAPEDHGVVSIRYRLNDTPEEVKTVNVSY